VWSASRPGRFLPPGKTRYPLYRRQCGLQSRSRQVRKISPTTGFDPRTVQPVDSRYTDWTSRLTGITRCCAREVSCLNLGQRTTYLYWGLLGGIGFKFKIRPWPLPFYVISVLSYTDRGIRWLYKFMVYDAEIVVKYTTRKWNKNVTNEYLLKGFFTKIPFTLSLPKTELIASQSPRFYWPDNI
jgi:hypothetical protein